MSALGLLLLTLVPAAEPGSLLAQAGVGDPEPVLRLWMNNSRQYREGERARVQVEARDDGYLVVLNYDTEGRLRVLFPVDPGDDNFVRAGRRYEIRGRGDRESFLVTRSGDGLVYAAISADPFDFRDYEVAGNWDYNRLYLSRDPSDPEADITELLQRMASARGFDYDVLPYRVWGYRDYRVTSVWYPRPYGFYDDFYCDWWYRPSLFGCRYWWPSPYSVYVGFGYAPYRYGYGYWPSRSYYDPYWWYRNPWYGRGGYYGNRNWPVVVGRPRGYTIVRRGSDGSGSPRVDRFPGSFGGGSIGGGRPRDLDWRPRDRDAGRPVTGDRPDRPGAGRQPDREERPRPAAPERPRARRVPPGNATEAPRPSVERERAGGGRAIDTEARPRDVWVRPREDNEPRRDRPAAGSGDGSVRIYDVPGRRDLDAPRVPESGRSYNVPARRSDDAPRAGAVERPRNDSPRPRAEAPARRDPPTSPPRVEPSRSDPPRASSPPSRPPAAQARPPSDSRPSGGRPASGGGGRSRRP